MSYIDGRSPYQKAQDGKRCPTCGHRPQDDFDRLVRSAGGASVSQRTCPRCRGSGWEPPGGNGYSRACSVCDGAGRVASGD